MVFKAWKSHLGLRQFNAHSVELLQLSVMTKLLFCALVYRFCNSLELLSSEGRHVSLLRLARVFGQSAYLFAIAVLRTNPTRWLEHQLAKHIFYEQRKDRKNFFELLTTMHALG